jgi:hypothetical protein
VLWNALFDFHDAQSIAGGLRVVKV